MAAFVYILSALTCATCAWLLFKRFCASKVRLLMWSSFCFAGLTANNILLVIDLFIGPVADLSMLRLFVADTSIAILALGLAWEFR